MVAIGVILVLLIIALIISACTGLLWSLIGFLLNPGAILAVIVIIVVVVMLLG